MSKVTLREIQEKVKQVTALWLEELQAYRKAAAAQRELDKMRLEYVAQETKGQGDKEKEDGGEDAG